MRNQFRGYLSRIQTSTSTPWICVLITMEINSPSAYSNFINLETTPGLLSHHIQESLNIANQTHFEQGNWQKIKIDYKCEHSNNFCNQVSENGVKKEACSSLESNFKCASCDKLFNTKTSLRLHVVKWHKIKNLQTCELCGTKLDSVELTHHINTEHKSIDDRYYCKKCDFNTTNYNEISTHTHESRTCDECGKIFKTLEKFESHKTIHSKEKKQEKNFTCDTCGKRFAFGCLLRDHINLHTGAKPYLCQICGRSFSQKASLKQHAKTHNTVKPHKCTECDQGFFGKGDLKKHMRKHTGERPYVCEMCGEGFSQSSHLGFHKRTHTGERPYPCDVCGRGFTKKGDVLRHKRIHTGELPYLCQVCGKAFRQSTQCAMHIKNHHPQSQATVVPNPNPIQSNLRAT